MVWACDLMVDACANGQQLRCLAIIDEFTRECRTIDVVGNTWGTRVVEVLARVVSERGAPGFLRSDNGPEFASRHVLEWITSSGIEVAHIDPGKSRQNGTAGSFDGGLRDET
jgi:putative transposase